MTDDVTLPETEAGRLWATKFEVEADDGEAFSVYPDRAVEFAVENYEAEIIDLEAQLAQAAGREAALVAALQQIVDDGAAGFYTPHLKVAGRTLSNLREAAAQHEARITAEAVRTYHAEFVHAAMSYLRHSHDCDYQSVAILDPICNCGLAALLQDPEAPKETQATAKTCPCTADTELCFGSTCTACGHRDHGQSGCGVGL